MGFSSNLKKALLAGIIILLGCDVSMLFAAENNGTAGDASNNPQLQKLQAQIKAMQGGAAAAVPESQKTAENNTALPAASVPPLPSIAGASSQNQLYASSQQTGVLPPSIAAAAATVPPPIYNPASNANSPPQNNAENNTAQQNQNSASTAPVSQKDVNEVAFNAMVQNSIPMSPAQIQKLRSAYMASQFSAASTPGTPPRPTAVSVFADLSPGATPPVVRLGQGFVTSLVFVDSTGAPWPIESYDVGNPTAFNIQWDKVSNTLMIQSTVLYTYGNLAIKLRGLNTPVMITLIPGQKAVDYRVDMRVPGYGPNANPFSASTVPAGTSSDLLNILDGVPPPNSTVLKVEGGNCQAWLSGQKMYVRTRLTVLSPGWTGTLSSADGMHAYQMQPTPMLLVSQNGQVIQLKVEGF